MAEASWPDPADGRVVSEWQYEQLAARFSDDGLNGSPFDGDPVTAGSGMQVLVQSGLLGSVRGFQWESGVTDVPLAISSNASGAVRTDWVVLRLDRSDWRVRSAVREGSPGGGAPALVQQPGPTGVYEVPLARVRVTSGAASITGGDVTPWPLYIGSRIRPASLGRNPNPAPGEISWLGGRNYEGFDGSSWAALLQDTGWTGLPIAFPANWQSESPGQWCRLLNGVVHYEMNVRRIGSDLSTNSSDAAAGSHIATLPSGLRPARTISHPTTLTAGISGRLRIYANGEIYLQAPSHTVGVGRFLRHAANFPIG